MNTITNTDQSQYNTNTALSTYQLVYRMNALSNDDLLQYGINAISDLDQLQYGIDRTSYDPRSQYGIDAPSYDDQYQYQMDIVLNDHQSPYKSDTTLCDDQLQNRMDTTCYDKMDTTSDGHLSQHKVNTPSTDHTLHRRLKLSLVKNSANRCPTCDRAFPLRKTMLRHIRFVHNASKPFSCSSCSKTFVRKDTLTRHIAEQHVFNERLLIICKSCGRSVSKRAFREHIDSQVCLASRALVRNGRFSMLGHLLRDEDQDDFLVVLRAFYTMKIEREALPDPCSRQPSTAVLQQSIVSRFAALSIYLSEETGFLVGRTREVNCTVLVLALWLFARANIDIKRQILLGNPRWYFRKAKEQRIRYHRAQCRCADPATCSQLQRRPSQDPATWLLLRALGDGGILTVLSEFVSRWMISHLGENRPRTIVDFENLHQTEIATSIEREFDLWTVVLELEKFLSILGVESFNSTSLRVDF